MVVVSLLLNGGSGGGGIGGIGTFFIDDKASLALKLLSSATPSAVSLSLLSSSLEDVGLSGGESDGSRNLRLITPGVGLAAARARDRVADANLF